jgi:PUA domain protein
MNRVHLKKKEAKRVQERISQALKIDRSDAFNRKASFEAVYIDVEKTVFLIDGKPEFIEVDGEIFPALINASVLNQLPSITVDMGAVPHICNGANVMAPGVTKVNGSFNTDSIIVVLEERYLKKIAIAKALYNSNEIANKKQGRVAENLHYISDKFWTLFKDR